MNAVPGLPGPGSQLCLSCHDGTIAVNDLVNAPNSGSVAGNFFITNANALMGTDLTNDHPIGLDYSVSQAGDTSLVAIGTVLAGGTVRLIGNTQVECASCHDAHNATDVPFLRASNVGSAICLACHNK
jgi:predicted CXXCH cytochrome family protein